MFRTPENQVSGEHQVALLVLPGVILLDLAVPLQVFGQWPDCFTLGDPPQPNPYRLFLCGPEPVRMSGDWLATASMHPVSALERADTVIIPGYRDVLSPLPGSVRSALQAAGRRGARMISICLGAFALAEAGLLDGRRATTHWMWANAMRDRYPAVDVREQHLYVEDGPVVTSAGVLAGADLCLHILRKDFGQALSNSVARFLVSAPHRDGGQAQFIQEPVAALSGSLAPTRQWLLRNLGDDHSLRTIAQHSRVSVRTLSRRFQAETGETVMNWLTKQRVAQARRLLEESDEPIARVAVITGFRTLEMLRIHFQTFTGTSPQQYRRTFRGTINADTSARA